MRQITPRLRSVLPVLFAVMTVGIVLFGGAASLRADDAEAIADFEQSEALLARATNEALGKVPIR